MTGSQQGGQSQRKAPPRGPRRFAVDVAAAVEREANSTVESRASFRFSVPVATVGRQQGAIAVVPAQAGITDPPLTSACT